MMSVGKCEMQELETKFQVPLTLNEVTENTVVTVTCIKPRRYFLFGDKEITCQHDGSWSHEPECRRCGKVAT